MEQLRKSTSSAHHALDAQISIETIVASRENYLNYLTNFCGAFLEANLLVNWSLLENRSLPDIEQRQERYVNLMSDILELNQSSEPNPKLPTQNLSSPPSLATSAGALYVLEGSVHGGQHLHKKLKAGFLDLQAGELSFLNGFEDETMAIWLRFCDWVNALDLSLEEQEEACQAARTTFAFFHQHILASTS
jgi:heme oxygenase